MTKSTSKRPKRSRARGLGMARRGARRPQHSFDAREQFARIEGLGEVIVRARFEARDFMRHAVARGHEDHRNVVARRAQMAQRAQAIGVRHHDVEHDDRRAFEIQPPAQAAAVVQHGHVDAARSGSGAAGRAPRGRRRRSEPM